MVQRAAVFLIIVALAGPSAGIVQCELTCAMEPATAAMPHCHGAGSGGGTGVADAGHACDHDTATLAATSPELIQKTALPIAVTIASAAGLHSPLMVVERVAGFSPPGGIRVASSPQILPLRL